MTIVTGPPASPGDERWDVLAACIGAAQPATVACLVQEIARVRAAGARPFEVIAGAPHHRYGARITFETSEANRERAAAASGLPAHPWGAPDWIGLRVSPAGDVVWKAYHRFDRVASLVAVPPQLPPTLVPVMAARHGGTEELYFRRGEAGAWLPFVDDVCRAMRMDLTRFEPGVPAFRPLPRERANSFCVSVKFDHDHATAISLFADDRALPHDRTIAAEWAASLAAGDRLAYEAALAGVRALGPPPPRGWHAMLAWTVDARHGWSQAASLRIR